MVDMQSRFRGEEPSCEQVRTPVRTDRLPTPPQQAATTADKTRLRRVRGWLHNAACTLHPPLHTCPQTASKPRAAQGSPSRYVDLTRAPKVPKLPGYVTTATLGLLDSPLNSHGRVCAADGVHHKCGAATELERGQGLGVAAAGLRQRGGQAAGAEGLSHQGLWHPVPPRPPPPSTSRVPAVTR